MYNLQFKRETFGDDIPFIDSGHLRWIRGALTLDAVDITTNLFSAGEPVTAAIVVENGKTKVKVGAFLGRLANGKWTVHNEGLAEPGAAENPSNVVPAVILGHDVDITDGDAVATGLDHARVLMARLPVVPNAYVQACMREVRFV